MRYWPTWLTLALIAGSVAAWWWWPARSVSGADGPPTPLSLGQDAIAVEDFDAALAHLDEAVRRNPRDALALRLRGLIHRRRLNADAALADYDAAIKIDPKSAEAISGRLFLRLNVFRDPEAALKDADAMAKLVPDSPTGHLYRTYALLSLKRYDEAKRAARLAKEKSGDELTGGLLALAAVASRLDRYDEALRHLDELLKREPMLADAHDSRSRCLFAKGDLPGALAACDRAIAAEPRFASLYAGRAATRADRSKKDYEGAIDDCTRAIHLDAWSVEAFAQRGTCRWKLKRYDAAREDFAEAIRLDAHAPDGHNALGWALATCPEDARRDAAVALWHATKACELTRWKDVGSLGTLAAAWAEKGDFEKAARSQTLALEDKHGYYPADRAEAEQRLAAYKAGKPWRDK